MNSASIIARQSLVKNLKSFNFWFMILFPILLIGVMFVIVYFSSDSSSESQQLDIAVVSEVEGLGDQLSQSEGTNYQTIDNLDEGLNQLESEEVDGVLNIEGPADSLQAELITTDNISAQSPELMPIQEILTAIQAQARAQALGVSTDQLTQLMQPVSLSIDQRDLSDEGLVDQSDSDDDALYKWGLTYAMSFIIFIVIVFYPNIIVTDLGREKGTRVMEVILSSTSSTAHFIGKMLAIFAMVLIQLLIYGLTAVIAWQVIKRMDMFSDLAQAIDWSKVWGQLSIYHIIFVLLGVVTVIFLAAFLGSMSSSIEDGQKTVMPLTMVGMFGYFIALSGGETLIAKIASFVPLFSAFAMPIRLTYDEANLTEVWISIAISVLFLVLVLAVTLKFYRSNLLVYSDGGFLKGFKQSRTMAKSNK